jgi:hypothetical protein
MANYCLAADRFLHHGYYDLPAQTDLEGRDYTQHYWFMHGLQQIRPQRRHACLVFLRGDREAELGGFEHRSETQAQGLV